VSGQARHTKDIPGILIFGLFLMGLSIVEFLALLWKESRIFHSKNDGYKSLSTDEFNPIFKRFSKPSPAVKKMAQLMHHTKHQYGVTRNMLKFIVLSLKRIVRSRAWIIEGTEVASGEHLNVVYMGKEGQMNYIKDLIFKGNCKEKYIEKRFFWPLFHLIKNLSKCSLMIIEGHYHDYKSGTEKGEFFIPLWLQGNVNIPLVASSRSAKDDLRKIRKYQLEYVVTKELHQFHDFFYNMYLPYIKKRHQDRALLMDYDIMMQRAKDETCELLLVKKNNESIAGQLIVFDKNHPRLWSVGVKDGNLSHLKIGVVGATYYFSSLYLVGRGYEKLHAGSSRAFLKDGVLQYKKKWGVRFTPHDNGGFLLKPLSRSKGLKGFFTRNPFIFVNEGKMSSAVFIENDETDIDESYEKLHKEYYLTGLDEMIIYQYGDRENRMLNSHTFKQSQKQ
jgi:hypothetical protein